MRRPTVADVLEAVTYVGGVNPLLMGRHPRTMNARRLAIHGLREITGCSWTEVAREMGYADHSTPFQLAKQPVDYDDLRAVVARVDELVGA